MVHLTTRFRDGLQKADGDCAVQELKRLRVRVETARKQSLRAIVLLV